MSDVRSVFVAPALGLRPALSGLGEPGEEMCLSQPCAQRLIGSQALAEFRDPLLVGGEHE